MQEAKNEWFQGDIWAMGCVFFEMLTCKRPFGGLAGEFNAKNVMDINWRKDLLRSYWCKKFKCE